MVRQGDTGWLVKINGNLDVLDSITEFLSPLNISICRKDGDYYLTSPKFKDLTEAGAVFDLATGILAVIDGMLLITTGNTGKLATTGVHDKSGTAVKSVQDSLGTQYIFPKGIPSEAQFGIPTICEVGTSPSKENHPIYKISKLACLINVLGRYFG